MNITPNYKITPEILELLSKIDANRFYFSSLKIRPEIREKIQRISLLKSSLFSVRIEGNPLTMKDLPTISEGKKKKEIFNVLNAIKIVEKKRKITKNLVLSLHLAVMKGIEINAGKFRTDAGAIFNQAGQVVYQSPPPSEILNLMEMLIKYANSRKERFALIKASIVHLFFEKIHPFVDGNGRIGRLLFSAVLLKEGVDFGVFIPFEEYIDERKGEYYFFLDQGLNKTEDYLIFMLKAFYEQTEKIKNELLKEHDEISNLPPRREEIYRVIKDHGLVSFDFIQRRFLKIPGRTLRYDLKKLMDLELIAKVGGTKGAFYRVK